jgi:hypothetical protein
VEKSLAEGTAFNLVPSMNVSSGTGPAYLSWVWRSSVIGSTQTREAARETFFENQRERARGRLDPQPDRSAIVPSADSVGGRSRPDQVPSMLTRDIEFIFQGLADQISAIYARTPDSDSEESEDEDDDE